MAGALSIRLAGVNDRARWMALWQGWQAHMEGSVPGEVSDSTWQKIAMAESGLWSLMAFDGEDAVGIAIVTPNMK